MSAVLTYFFRMLFFHIDIAFSRLLKPSPQTKLVTVSLIPSYASSLKSFWNILHTMLRDLRYSGGIVALLLCILVCYVYLRNCHIVLRFCIWLLDVRTGSI